MSSWYTTLTDITTKISTEVHNVAQETQNRAGELRERVTEVVRDTQTRERIDKAKAGLDTIGRTITSTVTTALESSTASSLTLLAYPPPPNPASLDTPCLNALNLTYITSRIITTSHPGSNTMGEGRTTKVDGRLGMYEKDRCERAVVNLMEKRNPGKWLLIDVSEIGFPPPPPSTPSTSPSSILTQNSLTYSYPGHPAMPLMSILQVTTMITSYLNSEPGNVVVISCGNGKGRSGGIATAVLEVVKGEGGGGNELEYVAKAKKISVEELTLPSQRRYIGYVSKLMVGVTGRVQRLIITSIKIVGWKGVKREGMEGRGVKGDETYAQVFKGGKLRGTIKVKGEEEDVWTAEGEEVVFEDGEVVVEGDVLVRIRTRKKDGRVSLCRVAFHAGFVRFEDGEFTSVSIGRGGLDGAKGWDVDGGMRIGMKVRTGENLTSHNERGSERSEAASVAS